MKRLSWVVTAVIVALGGLGSLWAFTGVTSSALDDVYVYTDAEPLICSHEPTVMLGTDDDAGEFDEHIVTAVVGPDLACDLRIFVSNESEYPVEITEVWLPFMGSDSGIPIRAVTIDGQVPVISPELSMDPREGSRDALIRYETPVVIEPGDKYLIVAPFVHSDAGCLMGGGSTAIVPTGAHPTVTAKMNGIDRELPYTGASYGFAGEAGC
ncbi:hypothetical protein EYE40_11305 [Glaciihabitans arcticus]|uniref:Uncharacterized protein n=1 Tax=Glaciihabitans arcticus TaxID=2668039 RepID=A0A4Q9GSE9_9MICO|nr:hypothetical protein [Glaciihabitans arcticus]TBN57936.1 hypothetical protein EYE40_11305 [Glaciihabitans arcticus]